MGVIKAEIGSREDLDLVGSTAAAKPAGKARMEGTEYVMSDGVVLASRVNL